MLRSQWGCIRTGPLGEASWSVRLLRRTSPRLVRFVLISLLQVTSHSSKWRWSISFGIFLHCFVLGCSPCHFSPAKNSTVRFLWGNFFSFFRKAVTLPGKTGYQNSPRRLAAFAELSWSISTWTSLWGGPRAQELWVEACRWSKASGPGPAAASSVSAVRVADFFFLFCLNKILFIYFRGGKGGRKRGREISMCGCLSCASYWHVPWLGIEPAMLWFTVQCSIHWATPARVGGWLLANIGCY